MKLIVHQFTMGDVEDPDLYAAEPIWKWQQTEAGKWVMENSVETPSWHRVHDGGYYGYYGYQYQIQADLNPIDATWYLLKWGTHD